MRFWVWGLKNREFPGFWWDNRSHYRIDVLLEEEDPAVPYLRFKGFDEGALREILPRIVDEFSCVAAVPREIVKVELLSIRQITDTPRSLEIYMFPREQKKHDRIAATLYDLLSQYNYPGTHIFFVLLTPSLYYKEGMPLKNLHWLPECHFHGSE